MVTFLVFQCPSHKVVKKLPLDQLQKVPYVTYLNLTITSSWVTGKLHNLPTPPPRWVVFFNEMLHLKNHIPLTNLGDSELGNGPFSGSRGSTLGRVQKNNWQRAWPKNHPTKGVVADWFGLLFPLGVPKKAPDGSGVVYESLWSWGKPSWCVLFLFLRTWG